MFKSVKKYQLFLFIVLLALFLFVFALLNKESNKLDSVNELKKEVVVANLLSKVIHELQKERGISSGYLASSGAIFQEKLKKQRLLTNSVIAKVNIKNLDLDKKRLFQKREEIDKFSLSTKETILFYSAMIDKLLKRISNIAQVSKIPQLTQSILAYSNFLYSKENAGIERAIGTVILSNRHFFKSDRIEFIKLIAMQELYLKKFSNFACDDFINYYKKTIDSAQLETLADMRETIIKADSYENIDVLPEFWLVNMTIKIDKLNQISDYIENEIIKNIQNNYNKILTQYSYYFFLNALLSIVFFIISKIFIKNIKKERRRRLLLEKYVISSTTDLNGNITYASEAFCKISGYTEKELLGKPHNIVRHPEIPKSTFKNIWYTIKNKKIWTGRIKNLTKDGGSYWVYATIEPLFDRKGDIEGYAAVRIDITSSISLEEKVTKEVEKNREKDQTMLHQSKLAQMGEMISMIAHQWRQPLSAISATSGSISLKSQIGTLDKEIAIELSNKITEYAQHLSATIDDFRNFFKDNKKKEITTFKEMVLGTLSIVEVSLKNANIAMELDLESTLEIKTYINEVKQVILNIIKNAEDILLDKCIENPKITISISDNILSIADNAGGIPEEIIEKIFEPYFSTKKQKDGTGLGLYMSKTIIEEHCDGKLDVYNSDKGAIFNITLPMQGVSNDQ